MAKTGAFQMSPLPSALRLAFFSSLLMGSSRGAVVLIGFTLAFGARVGLAATDRYGHVSFGGVPVPGATVTAIRYDRHLVTVTDQQGVYRFADLADGVWTFRVEMLGFATIVQDITIMVDSPPSAWELKLLPFEEITRGLPPAGPDRQETARQPIAGRN